MKSDTRVAVIGAGPWGKNHIRIYRDLLGVELAGIVESNPETIEDLRARFRIPVYTDLRPILEDPSICALSICLPASLHYEAAKAALLHGKHILVEKPLVLDYNQATELISLAAEKKLILGVGQVFRYDSSLAYLKSEIKKGTFGKILYLSLVRLGLSNPRHDVGVIFNFAVHDLDIMCDLLDEELPEEITTVAVHALNRQFEDLALITAKFPSGTVGHTQLSWLIPQKTRELWLVGEKKSAHVDTMRFEVEIFNTGYTPKYDDFGTFQMIRGEGDSYKPSIKRNEPLKDELQDFISAIQTGKALKANSAVGLRTIMMAETALQSSRERRSIRLSEMKF